jgi:transposase-like protein
MSALKPMPPPQELVKLYIEGRSLREIALSLGCSHEWVRMCLHNAGILGKRTWPRFPTSSILQAVESSQGNMRAASRLLGCSHTTVYKRMVSLGIHPAKKTPKEKFLSKVHLTPSCWIWTGSANQHGYPLFQGNSAIRAGWELFREPPGSYLSKRCPTPRCVNPWHFVDLSRSPDHGLPTVGPREELTERLELEERYAG